MFKTLFASICLFIWSGITYSDETQGYLEFFEKYQYLGDNFDTSVSDLYADNAIIIGVRKMPDGIEQSMKIEGKKWKEMIVESMDIGKQRNDKSVFSNIEIKIEKNKAKITAHRYSTVKCFKDVRYYMIIENNPNNEMRIVEEHMESAMQTRCKNPQKNDLSLVLKATVNSFSKHLPIKADSDTNLTEISSKDETLILKYVLVNYLSTEIDAIDFEKNLKPIVEQQSCTLPNFKPVLDQGGTMSYRYFGKNNVHIMTINVSKDACM